MLNGDVLTGFKTVSLEEMGKVKLMNRIDTKFIANVRDIARLLILARDKYMIQEIDGEYNLPYYTCYYDTEDANMYYQHQRGKKTRQKIRKRLYESGDIPPFLEVKSKNNKGRTKKKRVLMETGEELPEYSEFLDKHARYSLEDLRPVIENHFYRITLVNPDMTERVTIDTNLEFHNFITDERVALPDVGIIEWKRDGKAESTMLKDLLRELRIHEGGFSKYIVGMALTNQSLPHNRIKKKLRKIEKISQ